MLSIKTVESTEAFVLELTDKAIFREKERFFNHIALNRQNHRLFFSSSILKITPKLETSQHSGPQSSNLL